MQPRQKNILKVIIREYCQNGEPVGSLVLSKKYGLDFSAATIRGEMMRLERKGYLSQPHTSAGRVPTDKGLRFFVDELMDRVLLIERERRIFQEYVNRFIFEQHQLLKGAAKALARVSRNLGFSLASQDATFYGAGYADLLKNMGEENYEEAARMFDILEHNPEKKLMRIFKEVDDGVKVFVGEENPINEFKNYSLVVASSPINENERMFIGIMGPKKMDYAKNCSLVGELAGWFERRVKI